MVIFKSLLQTQATVKEDLLIITIRCRIPRLVWFSERCVVNNYKYNIVRDALNFLS